MTQSPNESSRSSDGSGHWTKALREAAPYLDLGWRIALTLVLFVGGGYWLDQRWDTLPGLTIAGAILGMVSVFAQIVRLTKELNNRSSSSRDEEA